MTKKYIQNCTGADCNEKKGEKSSPHFSFLISKIIFFVLLTSFFSVSVYVLFFSQYLQVLNIEIVGVNELNADEIKKSVEGSFQGKYLGIVSKNNFLFVSQKKLSRELLDNFKKIRSVNVEKKFPDFISVNIDERKALLVWCSGEKCYLMDENGFAYAEADFNSPEFVQNHLLQIRDGSMRSVGLGEKIIDSSFENFVLNLKESLFKIGFDINGEYATPSRMSQEIRIKTTQGVEMYFSMQFPLESTMLTLDTILKKEIPRERLGELEYIDLRSENKVFYKFKSQVSQVDEYKDSNE